MLDKEKKRGIHLLFNGSGDEVSVSYPCLLIIFPALLHMLGDAQTDRAALSREEIIDLLILFIPLNYTKNIFPGF